MNTYDLIMKKRDGYVLDQNEIEFIVQGFTNGLIPDYQMASLLMAIYFQGMNYEETTNLTMAMADSGERLDLSEISGKKVDKHSTGGVGDKTSLIIGPILASLGVPVAKMSGRGLGHTGGTIDKLESIPGFKTSISEEQFKNQVNKIKLSIVGQTANLAPADKKIYALRDVTATVDNVSLIAASIMSKKLAAGADAIILDVKVGSGAFMKNIEDARLLAKTMVAIGTLAGKETTAVITDMNEPLGNMVGNILEIQEVISCLKGNGEHRLMEVTKTLASHMLLAANKANSIDEALDMIQQVIDNGKAYEKLIEFVSAQGGDSSYIKEPIKLRKAKYTKEIYGFDLFKANNTDESLKNGYLVECNNQEIGMTCMILGGGRENKESEIDLSVGIEIKKHLGEFVKGDDIIGILYANDEEKLKFAYNRFVHAYKIHHDQCVSNPIVYEVICKDDSIHSI